MKIKYLILLSLAIGINITPVNAKSYDIDPNAKLTIGTLASYHNSGYDMKDGAGITPLFLYNNHRIYAEGSEAGVYIYKDNSHWAKIALSYDTRHFDPKESDNPSLHGLNKRKPSINAQASYMYITPLGGLEIKGAKSLSDSKGASVSLTHRSMFTLLDDRLTVYPKIGLTWYDKKYNQYYYGIDINETSKLKPYEAKDSVSPYIALSGQYKITDKIGIFANQRLEWLSSSQKNSPLTDENIESATHIGMTYTF